MSDVNEVSAVSNTRDAGDVLEVPDGVERVLGYVDKLSGTEVCTYGEVAAAVGTGPRQVGAIMAKWGHLTQWWRVVRADGTGYGDAAAHWDEHGIAHRGNRVLQERRNSATS